MVIKKPKTRPITTITNMKLTKVEFETPKGIHSMVKKYTNIIMAIAMFIQFAIFSEYGNFNFPLKKLRSFTCVNKLLTPNAINEMAIRLPNFVKKRIPNPIKRPWAH